MKLEDQVCSLEHAKKLKELGVKQESHFVWVEMEDDEQDCFSWNVRQRHKDEPNPYVLPAFTVAELGEMLSIYENEDGGHLASYPTASHWKSQYGDMWGCDIIGDEDTFLMQCAPTEADARAKMLIYLIENNLITV